MLQTPALILGTGRCGSTMLSHFLNQHPEFLSLSECFSLVTDLGGRIAEAFPEEEISAARFLKILATAHPKIAAMMRHRVAMAEVLYQPGPGKRFSAEAGVPALLQTVLPHLSEQPDQLFDEVCASVLRHPSAKVGQHYRQTFDDLALRFGRKRWVERSGGSLRIAQRLLEAFPDAKIVHLIRDGRDCALSMSHHLGFRMVLIAIQLTEILGVDPFESDDRQWLTDLPDDLVDFLPEHFDREAFLAYETPLALCGHYWSGEIIAGLKTLAQLPAERLLSLHYEDFTTNPKQTLEVLFRFLGAERLDSGWIEQIAAQVKSGKSRWAELPPSELEELSEACRPGFEALAKALDRENPFRS